MRLRGISGIEPAPGRPHHKRRQLYESHKQPSKEEFRKILMERIREKNGK